MKIYLYIIPLLLLQVGIQSGAMAQTHYSITYPYKSVREIGNKRNVQTCLVDDTTGYMVSIAQCRLDRKKTCTVLSKVSLIDGHLIDWMFIPFFRSANIKALLNLSDTVVVSGFPVKYRDSFYLANARVAKDFSNYSIQRVPRKAFNSARFSIKKMATNGVLPYKNRVYSYGNNLVPNYPDTIVSVIVQWDSAMLHPLNTWIYKQADGGDYCRYLKLAPNGHLAFINNTKPRHIDYRYNYINEIDTTGKIVYSYYYFTGGNPDGSDNYYGQYYLGWVPFVTLPNGDFAFYHKQLESTNEYETRYISRVDRISKQILWDYKLYPGNRPNEGQILYILSNMFLARNGDIVVGGTYYPGGQDSINGSGFIARLSPDGEERWMRHYLIPYPPEDTAALEKYKDPVIKDILELPNGDILATGLVFNWVDSTKKDKYTQDWLLRIGPNGCLNATDCGEYLILLNTEQISPPQIEQEVFTLSPNPIREGEDIRIPEEISFLYYDISDMSGQIHRYGKAIDQNLRTRDLPAGYYTILLYSKNTMHQAKLIIQ